MAKKKPITVLRKRRLLHLGFDPDRVAGSGELMKSLPKHYENHAPGAPDRLASIYQLYRPEFPDLSKRATPGRLSRMAREMKRYDLIVSHGEEALRAVLAHTAFAQTLGLPPLVHYQQRLANLKQGPWHDFKHRFAMTRTPAIVVPTEMTGRALISAWQVPPARVHPIAPIYGKQPKAISPSAIPRLMKRKGEKWIGVSAQDIAPYVQTAIDTLQAVGSEWRLVVLGGGEASDRMRRAAIDANLADRLLTSDRYDDAGAVAPLFDLALVRAADDIVPPSLPTLIGARVPVITGAPREIGALLPEGNAGLRFDADDEAQMRGLLVDMLGDDAAREDIGKANRAFARTQADAAAHHALFAELMGLARLD